MPQTLSPYLTDIKNLVDAYLQSYPEECNRLQVLRDQISDGDAALNSRSNMIGHLTASALVVNGDGQCLLIAHKALKRWLQPGGHLEPDESPEAGALRELVEETGLSLSATGLAIIDIDSHKIPASAAKGESEHLHHDFQFVFKAPEQATISLELKEIDAFKWVALKDLQSGEYGSRLARVAGKLLS